LVVRPVDVPSEDFDTAWFPARRADERCRRFRAGAPVGFTGPSRFAWAACPFPDRDLPPLRRACGSLDFPAPSSAFTVSGWPSRGSSRRRAAWLRRASADDLPGLGSRLAPHPSVRLSPGSRCLPRARALARSRQTGRLGSSRTCLPWDSSGLPLSRSVFAPLGAPTAALRPSIDLPLGVHSRPLRSLASPPAPFLGFGGGGSLLHRSFRPRGFAPPRRFPPPRTRPGRGAEAPRCPSGPEVAGVFQPAADPGVRRVSRSHRSVGDPKVPSPSAGSLPRDASHPSKWLPRPQPYRVSATCSLPGFRSRPSRDSPDDPFGSSRLVPVPARPRLRGLAPLSRPVAPAPFPKRRRPPLPGLAPPSRSLAP